MPAQEQELKDVYMTKSGESIRFAHGTYVITQVDGKKHCDLTLNNVDQYEMFEHRKEENKDVEVTFTTQEGDKFDGTLNVKTVNRHNEQRNVIELESKEAIAQQA
ncbi:MULTISPECIES: hypothetical protein [Pontibacillus]|uniref:Uncharacterized protein n=1 Tax=Pontibacillus chungwhensis TaxID=265426 RepID=A0ABY8V095_9BACI|nr:MULTISPECIES: hypothetical protein [Pontibacillus]MCD5325712.1 hypothetical protein [Pontibacillus sp. HN14]WIF98049.1 hypothetical protein QNI29_20365 [Pontibacillus chungwhensis]